LSCRVAWWTDIHFELLAPEQEQATLRAWAEQPADCAIVTGDISGGRTTLAHLRRLAERFDRPIYLVLGNHDFYGTSIERRRRETVELCEQIENLVYLTAQSVVPLSPSTALVGHDGWGDAREGDFDGTPVRPPDLAEIEELTEVAVDRGRLRQVLERLGDEAAEHLARVVPEALSSHRRVVVALHVPPLRETSWYEGRNSSDLWLPYFCCRAAGDVLLALAEQHPQHEILVLCGHCHGSGDVQVRENLRVLTSGAEPCSPQIQHTLDFA
jgi:3',5'-cyclic-AMP phosphodiesterase